MPSDSDALRDSSEPDEIEAVITEAFATLTANLWAYLQTEYNFERIETEIGTAVRFTVHSHMGDMHCLYPLKPVAKSLLEKYPPSNGAGMAISTLQRILSDLPLATHIGVENAYDSAKLAALEAMEAAVSVAEQSKARDVKKRRSETIKTMNARNAILVEPPKSGPQADVSIERLCAAVHQVRGEGIPLEQITAMALANKLGCEENSIHKALKRHKSSLKDFLSRFEVDS